MKVCSFKVHGEVAAGILLQDQIYALDEVNRLLGTNFPTTLSELIGRRQIEAFGELIEMKQPIIVSKLDGRGVRAVHYAAPYYDPPKIWCIGLNYLEHASDLNVKRPDEPASFMKPSTTIIGPGETIILPKQSRRVTAEGELAVIIGEKCKDVTIVKARDYILGYTTVIDMTAEDILERNPRFLTRSKSFDTFFSFGPWIVTKDEFGDLQSIRISTLLNGRVERSNVVANMAFSPYDLVSFHSQMMTLLPGDIISTGTPGAVRIKAGDIAGCQVDRIGVLENPVSQ